ncbi:MAG: beta-CASP ribonuclease aCPSF1 [Candidatus Methanomethylicota archaeon]|uniref:Transcription termination factor FttA n=2 Tax=Thermoproteota archaeon TaxID=2056631 RepID=A0A497EY24_9CREN|nr:MAG: beta-CASP ribonuclease aCPSF1 [Candidatus Verstraetearchaeota archaeon]
MLIEDTLVMIREVILKTVPLDARITRIEFEGPEIAIYSANPRVLYEDETIIRKIAKIIKKRIIVRSDPKVRLPQDRAIEIIKEKIPPEIQVGEIHFDDAFGEVIIEVDKPGLVIVKYGDVLKQVAIETNWRPKVVRKPPMKSVTLEWVKRLTVQESDYRKKILRNVGSRIHRPTVFKSGDVRITCLGGFREVGRSAILVETPESVVLLDCGVKTGVSYSINEFPRLDAPEFDIERLDAVVISHAHLDHCGFLPFLFKYGYDGPVYCTQPTRDLMALLQVDYLEVAAREGGLTPYSMRDVREALLHTIPLDYGEVTDIAPDIRLTFHNSGHILGSAMVHLHIGEGAHNLVYTGDFKFGRTRLLEPASYVFPRVETLIIESTYGAPSDVLPQRIEAEHQLIEIISQTISRGGKVLIPVLSVGRSQEIMLVLNEAFTMKYLPKVPVYIEGMVQEATAIHMAYPENLSKSLREKMLRKDENPFMSEAFHLVSPRTNREELLEGDPCIIIATSGMLTGGPALEYFKLMAPDEKNSIIFVSYQIAGTLGRRVLSGVKEIPIVTRGGKSEIIQVKLRVHSIQGFSGHSDRRQLLGFMKRVTPRPEKVIVCHGEEAKAVNLAETFRQLFKVNAYAPYNLETIRLK